jgi:hypothetical protein
MGRKSKTGLPRHVMAKRLKNDTIAYYWNAPPRARQMPRYLRSLPLGIDRTQAEQAANNLNAVFDRYWRGHRGYWLRGHPERVRALLDIPNGFLSSVENKTAILSE